MSCSAKFSWDTGILLDEFIKHLTDFCRTNQMDIGKEGRDPVFGGAPFRVMYRDAGAGVRTQSFDANTFRAQNPLASPDFSRVDWQLFHVLEQVTWFWCCIYCGLNEPIVHVRDGKLFRTTFAFDEELNSWSLTVEETRRAITKYRQIRELFTSFDCDEVAGFSDSHDAAGTASETDPEHRQKIFRFAKAGRQIFICPMEEGRARRQFEYDWQRVVD